MPKLSVEELNAFFNQAFAKNPMIVEELSDAGATIRHPIASEHLRPGETVLGPVLMAVADTAAYAAVLARIGLVPLAVTASLNIHFLRRPRGDRDVLGRARMVKLGRRLAVSQVDVLSDGESEPVACATVAYALPAD